MHLLVISNNRLSSDAIAYALQNNNEISTYDIIRCGSEKQHLRHTKLEPNVLVIDACCFGDRNRLPTTVARLKRELPDTQIAILSGDANPGVVTACIEAGCSGFILKSEPLDDVVETIRELKAGRSRCCQLVADAVLEKIRSLSGTKLKAAHEIESELTVRETEVLQLVEEGLLNKEIASQLGVRLSTVKNHLSSVYHKLKVSNRREAVSQALAMGILSCHAEPLGL